MTYFKKPLLFFFLYIPIFAFGQVDLDYENPKTYKIRTVSVKADRNINERLIASISGLFVGDEIKVPGDDFGSAIRKIWEQKLFADVEISITAFDGDFIDILISLQTLPKMSGTIYPDLSKSKVKALEEKLKLKKGDLVTEQYKQNIINDIQEYYIDKGYTNTKVEVYELADTLFQQNSSKLKIIVDRGYRIKIESINIEGNTYFSDNRLKRELKKTKENTLRYLLRPSKFKKEEYIADKEALIAFYNRKGYRDASIASDSLFMPTEDRIKIDLRIDEGRLYYFRNVGFSGNSKYSSKLLTDILNIKKGDVYDPVKLELNLRMNQASGIDVSTLYMDNGYLFFNVNPIEKAIDGDSVDLEIRIYEGPQATINRVTVSGNDRTNDHVVLRELRSRPGQKFSRGDIIRSQRELANLGYFDPEKLNLNTNPNPRTGTVDVEYIVSERPSDQIELSMGWGQNQLVGVLGLTLNNFSLRNLFKKGAWNGPIPMGDGQKLSLRAQSSGRSYQNYSFSFSEPWFGGKKPNSLSLVLSHVIQANGLTKTDANYWFLKTTTASIGVGKRLQKPDDYFTFSNFVSFQNYSIHNYSSLFPTFSEGRANTFYLTSTLRRTSIDQTIYPSRGSDVSLSLNATPPFSYFRDIDFETATDQEKYKWIEYHKWRFKADFYVTVTKKLVLRTLFDFGYLGSYNKAYGASPFERFYMGGDGISGYNLNARELIRFRGYQNNSITPSGGGSIFNKYTVELRYPITLNPQATVYLLSFMEAGNNVNSFKNFDPFNVYRSAGAGIRIFLPMFGLIGFDYGFGFDGTVGADASFQRKPNGQFHISIGQQF